MDIKAFWLGLAIGGGGVAGVSAVAATGDISVAYQIDDKLISPACAVKTNDVLSCFWDGEPGSVSWFRCQIQDDGMHCAAAGAKTVTPEESVGKVVKAVEK